MLPGEADLRAMLDVYNIVDEEHEELLRLAREVTDPNWVTAGAGRQLATLLDTERMASRITNVEPLRIPGLCQTEAYARAIFAGAGLTRTQVAQGVAFRLSRQALLDRDDAPQYVAIIGEYALRYPPCDPPVMIGQLRRLLNLADRPNVSVLVLPYAARTSHALEGAFVLMELRRGDPVVRLEAYRGTTTLSNSRDVRDYQAAVEDIRRQAMNEAESASFIGRLLNELESA